MATSVRNNETEFYNDFLTWPSLVVRLRMSRANPVCGREAAPLSTRAQLYNSGIYAEGQVARIYIPADHRRDPERAAVRHATLPVRVAFEARRFQL